MKKTISKDEIEHINWIYNRLVNVHKENPNYDYMLYLKEIVDSRLAPNDLSSEDEVKAHTDTKTS